MNYTIKSGDTLSAIAKKFNIDMQELADANHIADPDEIYAGTKLTIPGATNTTTTTSTPTTTTTAPTISKPTYTAPTYTESGIVQQAQAALNAQLANKPSAYQSQWQTQLDEIIEKIQTKNKEGFTYDLNGDALYQQYKDKYIQQGKMAMEDAIGQASAMTGGYGNSYAQSVGQQAYAQQLQNLNDIVPELYQLALDRYNMEKQDLYNEYALLGDRENLDYSRYRDEMSDYLTERDYLANRYDSERNFDYGKFTDNRDFGYGSYRDSMSDYQWQTSLDYQKARDEIADDKWDKEYDLAAGKVVGTKDTSTGHTGVQGNATNVGYDPKTSPTPNDIKQMQAIVGVGQDGKWGPKSTAAAGGLSLEEAYKAWKNGTLKKDKGDDAPTYSSIVNDLNTYIKNGASRSNVSTYLRSALNEGYISQNEYNKLKETFLPSGSSGGRYTY